MSWFFKWLFINAVKFGFQQNRHIDEPWHWEFKSKLEVIAFSDEEGLIINCDAQSGVCMD